jgi:tetratricopeptide (TPR) repeat protein
MDCTFRQCTLGLVLGCGLALVSGCGVDSGPVAIAADAQANILAPPQHFVANQARPMPLPRTVTAHKVAIPVQAQFAQPAVTSPVVGSNRSIYAPALAEERPGEPSISRIPPVASEPTPPAPSQTLEQAANSQPLPIQVDALNRRAASMAQKRMLFAAKNELIQALELNSQALDVHRGGTIHAAALTAGLTALREAEDFSVGGSSHGSVARTSQIAGSHKTAILIASGDIPPAVAQQQYFEFAQQQLAFAAGGQPAASRTLYTLGKIQLAMPGSGGSESSLGEARALVWFQAALAADSRNHLAANELGVLQARFGQLDAARRALLHSISIHPQVETWHNLAAVHERLGEVELARLAENERRLLAQRAPRPANSEEKHIAWVDASTFAGQGARGDRTPLSTASQPANTTRR